MFFLVYSCAKDLGKNQRDKLRKTSKKYIEETLVPSLENQFGELGLADQINVVVPPVKESDKDPVELFIEYKSVLPSINPYINKRVKLEISCRSLREPFKEIPMRSIIAEEYANVPPSEVEDSLRRDYTSMQQNFIYGDSLPYDVLIDRIKELQQRFRDIKF